MKTKSKTHEAAAHIYLLMNYIFRQNQGHDQSMPITALHVNNHSYYRHLNM